MDDNVIKFEKPREVPESDIVWHCSCGCRSFHVRADGEVECCACEGIASLPDGGDWRRRLPETPHVVRDAEPGGRVIYDIDQTGAALHRMLAEADPEKSSAVFVIQGNGSVHAWRGQEFAGDQIAWLDARIETARSIVVKD